MTNKLTIFSLAINLILIVTLLFVTFSSKSTATNMHSTEVHSDFNIPSGSANIPTVSLKTYPDKLSGYNVEIITTNFTFAPQKANQESTNYNEGHAHLFINSKKISRVYSNWVHIPQMLLTQENNDIRISLNSNTHDEYHYEKNDIEGRAMLSKTAPKSLDPQGITMSDLKTLIDDKKDLVLLDVRTPSEFADGHIPNSINIDVQNPNFKTEIEKLDKAKKYAVYCRSGNRSLNAYNQMNSLGFKDLYNLKEGFSAWQYLKLPVAK
jgi:rhodanese-related sulfurtransferase